MVILYFTNIENESDFGFMTISSWGNMEIPVKGPKTLHHLRNLATPLALQWGEWLSSSYSLRQVTEVKLGRVRSDSGWVTSKV